MRKICFYLMLIIMLTSILFCFSGCSSDKKEVNNNNNNKANTSTNQVTNTTEEKTEIDYKVSAEKQMALPKEGDTIAIFHMKKFGDIKVKFFPEIAPKAVENFTTHAKEGYYDGLTFHRVVNDFMIQGGDPDGNGTGGESIWGTGFGTELDYTLVPYRGSLCMAMSSLPNSIGSQFFITQANYSEEMVSYLKRGGYPTELINQYKNYGGYLSLYMQYTVFGQVYEGIENVDKIAAVETEMSSSGEKSKPVEDIIIESIEVTTYGQK